MSNLYKDELIGCHTSRVWLLRRHASYRAASRRESAKCPVGFDCNFMGGIEQGCENLEFCQFWSDPWHLPYQYQQAGGYGCLTVSIEPKYYNLDQLFAIMDAGFAKPYPIPYQYYSENGVAVLVVQINESDTPAFIEREMYHCGWKQAYPLPYQFNEYGTLIVTDKVGGFAPAVTLN